MKLETLSLRGMLRFTDPVTVDLRDLPPGLVAIVGPNGHGKTTLLESGIAALYRMFPSRDRELFDYATGRDSYIEATYATEGRGSFKARLSIDGVKRGADAVLVQTLPSAQGGHMIPLNDGKVSTFDAAVKQHFPPRELVLASAFAAQNRSGSFITLDKKGRKELFGQLLGLDHLDKMSATAKTAAGLVETTRARLAAARDVLTTECGLSVIDELDRVANDLQEAVGTAQARRAELRVFLDGLDARLADVQDQASTYLAASMQLQTLEAALAANWRRQSDIASEVWHVEDRLRADRERIVAERDAELRRLANTIANNEGLKDRADAIRGAAARVIQIDVELRAAHDEKGAVLAQQRALEQALAFTERSLASVHVAEQDLYRVKADTAILTRVPCGGSGDFADCSFLTNAKQAERRIPELETKVADKVTLQARVQERMLELKELAPGLDRLDTTISRLTNERTAAVPLAGLADKLAAAEARIAELVRQQDEARERADRAITDADQRTTDRLAAMAKESEDLVAAIAHGEVEIQATRAIREANNSGAALATTLQGEIAAARAEWDEMTRALAVAETRTSELQRRRHEVIDKRRRLEAIHRRIDSVDDELREWGLLAKALSKDGLQTLEIDAAGPLVSAYTDDLLSFCGWSKFSVQLITQDTKITKGKDGSTMKEVFSIRVFDNEYGSEPRDIGDLSGGEQVIVDEALKNAIAIFSNERSQAPMRTCWRDETTGALHPDNAARYVTMLRRVLALGHFEHVLFVTHNADAALAADAQIRVADGRATICLPPFTEA